MLTSGTFSLSSNESRLRVGFRGIGNTISSDLFPPGVKLPSPHSGGLAALAHLAKIIVFPAKASVLQDHSHHAGSQAVGWSQATLSTARSAEVFKLTIERRGQIPKASPATVTPPSSIVLTQ